MCTALAVLLYPQARATYIRLVIDPFVYATSPLKAQAFGGNCKDRSGLLLEFSLDRLQ
jgi:hypothetical protein